MFYSPLWRFFIRPRGQAGGAAGQTPRVGAGFTPQLSAASGILRPIIASCWLLITATDFVPWSPRPIPMTGVARTATWPSGFPARSARELLGCEQSVPGVAPGTVPAEVLPALSRFPRGGCHRAEVLTEGAIRRAVLRELSRRRRRPGSPGHVLSVRPPGCLRALREAPAGRKPADPARSEQGLLRPESGIPNRQTAATLVKKGVTVRWGYTHGEQLHQQDVAGGAGRWSGSSCSARPISPGAICVTTTWNSM